MKTKPAPEKDEIELRPDGWQRFEQAVDIAAKTPAIRRSSGSPPKAAERATRGTRRGKASA